MNYVPFEEFGPTGVSRLPRERNPVQKIAIVGSGIAGNTAAWLLGRDHQVTLYEAEARIGGHSNTVDMPVAEGSVPVDTGFIVYNELNYPHFIRLLDRLEVATSPSDMSFSVSVNDGKLEYIGAGLRGMFAQKRNWFSPSHWRLITDLVRFYKAAPGLKGNGALEGVSLGQMMDRYGYSRSFVKHHILPMAAAIWSTPMTDIMNFPATSFLDFFDNHGLFRLSKRPTWRTITGGSREYVQAINKAFSGRTLTAAPVRQIRRDESGVWVTAEGHAPEQYDQVVLATHGDEALAMLAQPSPLEQSILGGFSYSHNVAYLHRDASLMPRKRSCWASWNYLSRRDQAGDDRLLLTYWMNRLQPLGTEENVFVTLNPPREPVGTVAQFDYAHPMFNGTSLTSQRNINMIQGQDRIWYCGAHLGYGFHEDGVVSAVKVASMLGVDAPWLSELPRDRMFERLAAA